MPGSPRGSARVACRRPPVELVELVGELVVHDVGATLGVDDLAGGGLPVEQDRAPSVARLTRQILGSRRDDPGRADRAEPHE